MAAFWTIKGEAGKAMDDTVRDLHAVGAVGSSLSFPALDVDVFSYAVPLAGLAPASEILPENGQTVALYRNGVQFFSGIATRSQSGQVVNVQVMGAWWWLQRLTMTSSQVDSAGASSDRLSFGFPAQSLTTSLGALIDRAIALGAPIQKGTLAATFPCPQITLTQSTFADAISELVRLTPDVMAWFDYSTSPPTFNTSRRSSATARTLTAGSAPLETWTANPSLELKAEFVRLPYVSRGTDGRRVWQEQLSGDAGTAQSGTANTIRLRAGASPSNDAYKGLTVQITSGTGSGQTRTITGYNGTTKTATVNSNWTTNPNNTSVYKVGSGLPSNAATTHVLVVSGEELNDFLPNDTFESATLTTSNPKPAGTGLDPRTALNAFIWAKDSTISQLVATYGTAVASNSGSGTVAPEIRTASLTVGSAVRNFRPITYVSPDDPNVQVSTTGRYVVVAGDLPEWYGDIPFASVVEANLVLEYYAVAPRTGTPDWFVAMPVENANSGSWGDLYTGSTHIYKIRRTNIPVKLISTSYLTPTTIYKPADYSFVNPPEGFAAGLQASQDFVPYTGSVSLREQEAGGTRYRGCVVNIDGALPELATMGALVQSEELDLDSGTTTVTLGAAARLSYSDFVSRIRKTSQDNIVYL